MEIKAQPLPLREDEHEVIRVGQSRVTLQSVIYAYRQGATPEEIVEQFPVLSLADVYATIWYYLEHRDEVDAYLCREEAAADEERARWPQPEGLRAQLLARMKARSA